MIKIKKGTLCYDLIVDDKIILKEGSLVKIISFVWLHGKCHCRIDTSFYCKNSSTYLNMDEIIIH